eukprot:CAMPEP_0172752264 /NCGR_PEP_ID=MMETSP1074-20121228/153496_1 /TAXON_ID=2916 /ORGANISM="Ceratium fusus, Strain PA161109" /LENGTH=140 /DNA_ID=CAMNT_0013584755 /DNA_START=138 /DNA_END=561 /DNA_ORIENTATION=-
MKGNSSEAFFSACRGMALLTPERTAGGRTACSSARASLWSKPAQAARCSTVAATSSAADSGAKPPECQSHDLPGALQPAAANLTLAQLAAAVVALCDFLLAQVAGAIPLAATPAHLAVLNRQGSRNQGATPCAPDSCGAD